MEKFMPLFRALPLIMVFTFVIFLVVQLIEIWMTKQSYANAYIDGSDGFPASRVILMSAYLRVVVDFLWNIGFAALVYAGVTYLETAE